MTRKQRAPPRNVDWTITLHFSPTRVMHFLQQGPTSKRSHQLQNSTTTCSPECPALKPQWVLHVQTVTGATLPLTAAWSACHSPRPGLTAFASLSHLPGRRVDLCASGQDRGSLWGSWRCWGFLCSSAVSTFSVLQEAGLKVPEALKPVALLSTHRALLTL